MARKNSKKKSLTRKVHIILDEDLREREQFPNTESRYLVKNSGLLENEYITDIVAPKKMENKCYLVLHYSKNDGFNEGGLLTAKKPSSEEENSRLLYKMAREIAEYRVKEYKNKAKLLDKTRMSEFF